MPLLFRLCYWCAWLESRATVRAGAREVDISPPGEPSQATQDCHCTGTVCDVLSTPHPPWRETWWSCNLGARRLPAGYLRFSQRGLSLPNCPIFFSCSLLKACHSKQKEFCLGCCQHEIYPLLNSKIHLFLLNKSRIFVGLCSSDTTFFCLDLSGRTACIHCSID